MATKKGHNNSAEKSVYFMTYLDGQYSHPAGGYKLFFCGACNEDLDEMMKAIQDAYWIAKEKNKKYGKNKA